MANSEKKIPKSLKECYVTDSVSNSLWSWAGWLETWGKGFFIVLIIIGIISTVMQAVQVAEVDEGLLFVTIITSAITWALYAFIEYCTYHVLSLLIASHATIVQNTKITANVALYNTAKEEGILEQEDKKVTPPAAPKPIAGKASSGGDWICKECGTKNDAGSRYCKDCGKYK